MSSSVTAVEREYIVDILLMWCYRGQMVIYSLCTQTMTNGWPRVVNDATNLELYLRSEQMAAGLLHTTNTGVMYWLRIWQGDWLSQIWFDYDLKDDKFEEKLVSSIQGR